MVIGEEVRYRSTTGDLWPAKILFIRRDGTVDIEVDGISNILELHHIASEHIVRAESSEK